MSSLFRTLRNRLRGLRSRRKGPARDAAGRLFRFKYACFKDLLASNTELLNIITEFEEKLRGAAVFGMSTVRALSTRAVFYTLRMVKSLDDLSGHRYPDLFATLDKINEAVMEQLGTRKEPVVTSWVIPYSEITRETVDWVGGKNANLGELRNRAGLPIPEGFAVTTHAYNHFLDQNNLVDEIARKRRDIDPRNPRAVEEVSSDIQALILAAPLPRDLEDAMLTAYDDIAREIAERNGTPKGGLRIALRSSAIGEDSELSFAGQYLSVLNVPREEISEAYKQVIAGLYTPRAVSYRLNKGIRDEDIAMAVACIEMVRSVAGGVIYSRDPHNLREDNVLVTGVWGLGPYAVDGVVTPDSFVITKEAPLRIVATEISVKHVQLIAEDHSGLREVPVADALKDKPCLTEEQAIKLAEYAVHLETHYRYSQDIEWALDESGKLFVLQARPLHLEDLERVARKAFPIFEGFPILVEGGAVAFPGVGCGEAFLVTCDEDLARVPERAVVVAKHSTPQLVVVMRKADAIVTDAGAVTGHMASLSREFGIPTLVNAKTATTSITPGTIVTVDAFSGRVYEGRVEDLLALKQERASPMKDTPVHLTLRRIADLVTPLHLVDPRASNFAPEHCRTLHDIMRFVHELSYKEMFAISDTLSDMDGAGSLRLSAPIPLDLRIIDLGGGVSDECVSSAWVSTDEIDSVPMNALLRGMLHEDLRNTGPRVINLGGFFSVMRQQALAPVASTERFGDRSYAIISDKYLNFSSRIGYHYSVLDSYCGETVSKNYITFSFKGGAADDLRRHRRARAIGKIFSALDFNVDVREDRVDARLYKYERQVIEAKLDIVGRLLQFTRQMDMLMNGEDSVEAMASCFLAGKYDVACAIGGGPDA